MPFSDLGGHVTNVDVSSILVRYIRVDQAIISAGALFVLGVYFLWIDVPEVLMIFASLALLAPLLELAAWQISRGQLARGFLTTAFGHWTIAIVVSASASWLWPVMMLPTFSPVVVATPFIRTRTWFVTAGMAVGTVVIVATLGRHGPGVDFPVLAATHESLIVAVGIVVGVTPLAVAVSNNHKLLKDALSDSAALVSELHESKLELAASRRRVVDATDDARRQIEQDLHDGAQQRLLALAIKLQMMQRRDIRVSRREIADVEADVRLSISELRELAHGVYPPMLQTDGLVHALEAVADRSEVPTTVTFDDVGQVDTSIATAIYFSALEVVENSSKNGGGTALTISLVRSRQPTEELLLRIHDDGPGADLDAIEHGDPEGFETIRDRVMAIGGRVLIETAPGEGTTVSAQIPL